MTEADELDMAQYRLRMRYNVAILITIAACTAAVAFWANSSDGLWSMLLLLVWQTQLDDSEECDCQTEEEPEGDDERPLQTQASA